MSRYYTQNDRAASPEFEYADRHSNRAGYSSGAQLQPLRQDSFDERGDPGFDVRADFDGDGPRWSEMYGVAKQEQYRPVYDHDVGHGNSHGVGAMKPLQEASYNDPEMVSVPVLGPEWRKNELHEMSKRGRDEKKRDKRQTKWRAWNRDQKGCCGIPWLTRKVFVFIMFFFVAVLAVTLYFVIPRAVTFEFYKDRPIEVNDNSTIVFNRTPTNFSFDADLLLMADASNSYIPVQFKDIQATVFDLATTKIIGVGHLYNYKVPHKRDIPVRMPLKFSYSAINDTDTTWNDMYKACGHKWNGVVRPDLQFRLEVKQSIIGLTNKPISATQLIGITCPFELGVGSV